MIFSLHVERPSEILLTLLLARATDSKKIPNHLLLGNPLHIQNYATIAARYTHLSQY